MKLCKKWKDFGWKETKAFYSTAYTRTHEGKVQIVCQTPSRTMWRAIQYDEQNTPIREVLYLTMSSAFSYLTFPSTPPTE